MTHLLQLAALALLCPLTQATTGCKNCVSLGKEEKAMFRQHSTACADSSGVAPGSVETLLDGAELPAHELPAMRRHVYCVLLKCKLITKDGKLQKAALLGKVNPRADGRNATKVLESCADQGGDSPEDIAWNIFRCGYDKKAVLFDYMPTGPTGASPGVDVGENS